jgi:transcriptional regulator
MKQYSFATIVTVKDNFPTATHLPFIIQEKNDHLVLTAHFARANDQWEQISDNQILVIFSEPHAYISPRHYEKEENVPTWNYISVHAYGKGRIIDNNAESFAALEQMIITYEEEYKVQWDRLPDSYKQKMLKGIVAFEITVTDLQAKKKLSQNKTDLERERIIDPLSKSDLTVEKEIARYMSES